MLPGQDPQTTVIQALDNMNQTLRNCTHNFRDSSEKILTPICMSFQTVEIVGEMNILIIIVTTYLFDHPSINQFLFCLHFFFYFKFQTTYVLQTHAKMEVCVMQLPPIPTCTIVHVHQNILAQTVRPLLMDLISDKSSL